MVSRIRQWMVYKELLLLAGLRSFNYVQPERVIRILHSFARARLLAGNIQSPEESLRSIQFREALLSIWELSRQRYHSDPARRAKWHLVMASCNSLYEQFSRSPSAPAQNVRAAA